MLQHHEMKISSSGRAGLSTASRVSRRQTLLSTARIARTVSRPKFTGTWAWSVSPRVIDSAKAFSGRRPEYRPHRTGAGIRRNWSGSSHPQSDLGKPEWHARQARVPRRVERGKAGVRLDLPYAEWKCSAHRDQGAFTVGCALDPWESVRTVLPGDGEPASHDHLARHHPRQRRLASYFSTTRSSRESSR